jgi:hypothetical protein
MNLIWDALTHTPWWVYLLFFYLLKIGYDATKSQIVSFKKLYILPLVFLALSINTLLTSFQISPTTLLVYLLSLLSGSGIGWLLVRNSDLKFDHKNGLVRVPGTWVTLILIMMIFFTKYFFSYSLSVDPTLAEDTNFEFLMLSVSGVCTGLFVGRLGGYLYQKQHSTHCELDSVKKQG